MADVTAVFVPGHHHGELAPEEFVKLGAGLVDGLFRGLVLAAGDWSPPRFQAGRARPGDDAVDVPCFHETSERRYLVQFVALGDVLGGFRLDDFRYLVICPGVDVTSPPYQYIIISDVTHWPPPVLDGM